MANLSIAIFNPVHPDDAGHWTLHLEGEGVNEQYGLVDSGQHYSIDTHQGGPSASSKFSTSIPIGTVPQDKLDEVRDALKDESTVDNNSTHWNCQNWVMERAETLGGGSSLQNVNPDYQQQMQEANTSDAGNEKEFAMRDEQAGQGNGTNDETDQNEQSNGGGGSGASNTEPAQNSNPEPEQNNNPEPQQESNPEPEQNSNPEPAQDTGTSGGGEAGGDGGDAGDGGDGGGGDE